MSCSHQDAEATLCQVFKEALANGEQGPVVALEDWGGGHHQLGLRVHLRKLIQALTNPAPSNQARFTWHDLLASSCLSAMLKAFCMFT